MRRYPKIHLGSKNEIAKRISSLELSPKEALSLINDVLKNFDRYWYDSKRSEPEKEKYIRSAARSIQLSKLLELINEKILSPYDFMIPNFIFGGLSKRNSIQAAGSLLGIKKKRVLIKLDVKSFFEQISQERVFHFFHRYCNCGVRASRVLSSICCVPKGKKGSNSREKILARGFATSSRLAIWCNVGTFQHLHWKIKKLLKNKDPRIAIYVDDIGITAAGVSLEKMEEVKRRVIELLEHKDTNQPLPIHRDGKKNLVKRFSDGVQHLGIRLGRKRLSPGREAVVKSIRIKSAIKNASTEKIKRELTQRYLATQRYKKQVQDFRRVL